MAGDGGVGGALRRPLAEAVAALRIRTERLIPTARWDDLWQSGHDRGFSVAGAAQADLLQDLADAITAAIADGETLEQFRARFRSIVKERGWQGWTGQGNPATEAWRTRIIYMTNVRSAYAAGRVAQLTDAGYPLWVYRHGGSIDPRPEHLSWDGITLPPVHPWWRTHTTPNGWGCNCKISGARSPAQARRLGGDPDKQLPEGWDTIDPRTGAPPGIDRGWAYQPGSTVVDEIRRKAAAMPAPLGRDLQQGLDAGAPAAPRIPEP